MFSGYATPITLPYSFTAGSPISASQMMGNFASITSALSSTVSSPWVTSSSNIYFNAGSVGIGSSAPAYALDVSGSVRAATFLGQGQLKVPVFSIVQGASQSIPAAVETKVNLDTLQFDNFNYWDSANHRWNPKIAGYYQVNGAVMIANNPTLANGNILFSIIYKNGGAHARGTMTTPDAANYAQSNTSCIVYLNGTSDYVELWVYSESGHATNAGTPYVYMSCVLVST